MKLQSITGKQVSVLFVILFVVYLGVNMGTLAAFSRQSITPAILLDAQAAYTPEEAYQTLDSFGEKGRSILQYTYAADFLIPLLYALCLMAVISFIINKLHIKEKWVYGLALFPFVAMMADWLENVYMLKMMSGFNQDTVGAYIETIKMLTTIKLSVLLVNLGLVVVGVVALIYKFIWQRKSV